MKIGTACSIKVMNLHNRFVQMEMSDLLQAPASLSPGKNDDTP